MYWPIGAPRIYAASKHHLDRPQDEEDDESEARPVIIDNIEESNGKAPDETTEVDPEEETRRAAPSKTRKVSRRPTLLKNASLGGAVDGEIGGEIVGMKLSRTGHLFATITSSSLSIWQTKVSFSVPSILQSLILNSLRL